MNPATEPAPAGGRLTLVPTPIGHLEDVTLRALAVLREADVVAAEDTRHSRILLERHGVATPLVRLDAHTIPTRARAVFAAHRHVAYVTDAGTPGISDPGAELVRLALALGIHVEVLPGPTAFVPALVLSGLPVHRFAFEGFLPRRGRERRERLAQIAGRDHTSVLYEAPGRLAASLRDLARACGDERPAAVARELSKRFEDVRRGPLAALAAAFGAEGVRGEIVVVVGPAPGAAASAADPDRREGGERADGRAPLGRSAREADHGLPAAGPPDAEAADALARRWAARGLWGRDLRAALVTAGVDRDRAYRLAVRHGRRPTAGETPDGDDG